MVRLASTRVVASLLLLCVSVQAHPAARLLARQDITTSETDLSETTEVPPTLPSTDGLPSPTDGAEITDSTTTEEPTETSTDGGEETEPTPTDASESSTATTTDSETESDGPTTTAPPHSSVWISVNETDGRISTVYPSATEIDGVSTTLGMPDPDHTGAVDPGNGDPSAFLPTCDQSRYQKGYPPFCLPNNSTHMYFGNTYFITWDPTFWEDDATGSNNTIKVIAEYANDTTLPDKGRVAWESPDIPNRLGFTTFYVDEAKFDNKRVIHWIMTRQGKQANTEKSWRSGPYIQFLHEPIIHPQPKERSKPSTLGLAIGIPLGIAFIVGVIACLHFRKRETRSIGGIVIPSMRRRRTERGYGSRKSRGQRAGQNGSEYQDDINTRAAAWEMGNMKTPGQAVTSPTGPYHDEPENGGGIRARGETQPNPFADRYGGK